VRSLLTALALAALARGASAEGWEVALTAGKVIPFYNQTFSYDPGPLTLPISGANVEQSGAFVLDAQGALALNLAISRALGSHAAIEARLDTADVSVQTTGARYRVTVRLPAPLPPLSSDVDLGTGTVDLERLRPLSLNLAFRAGTRTRFSASAGVSWLPAFRFTVDQTIGLGLPVFNGTRLALDVGRAGVRAEALPSEEGQGRFGGNVGVSVSIPVAKHLAVVAEGRAFRFQKQTLHWGAGATSGPLSAIEQDLVDQIESRLPDVAFNPAFFHASAGLALRF